MNFEDEPYVRVYSRKTLTSRLLGWEGRVVLRAMVDEFDASGVFEIRGDAAQCVSAITEIPLEIVRTGLKRIVETETWIITARAITWPTYEEAQNCRRSDRLRQRESRRARSHSFVTEVTSGHDRGHSPSQQVTLPPSAPFHPPPLPSTQERDPERAREVSKTYSIANPEPPEEYLQQADAEFTPRQNATATWKHYHGAGLPTDGVERLYSWLLQRCREKALRDAKAPATRGSPANANANWEPSAKAVAYAKHHQKNLAEFLPSYRAERHPEELSRNDADADFQRRLVCLVKTGKWIPTGPLPQQRPAPEQATGT